MIVWYFVLLYREGRIIMPVVTTSSRLLIKAEGDHAIIKPLPDDPVDHFCGIFKGKASLTKALLTERRRERKRESKKTTG
jgi:hypothetical protein